jgi:hypothetical protein
MKKLLRFCFISVLVGIVFVPLCWVICKFCWRFDILSSKSYTVLYQFWEGGGTFKTFRDCSLIFCLLLMPILWLKLSYKLYKFGLGKFLLIPITKIYRYFDGPANADIARVSIKNIGAKDKSLDEIIADKRKEKNENLGHQHTSQDIRRQIAAKIEENEKE